LPEQDQSKQYGPWPPSPEDRDAARLKALCSYDVLDTPREQAFDDIAELASAICETPIAVVSLIDDKRQFFKAEVGLGVRETTLGSSFCVKALLEQDFLFVPDATKDPRFDCNPLVTGEPHLRFYAGALLKTNEGLPIGTVCVLDYQPRELTEVQVRTLRVLARQAMAQLELRRSLKEKHAGEVRHRRVLNSATDFAIVSLDLEGKITGWNRGAEIILGWSEHEVLGRSAAFIFTDEDQVARVPDQHMRAARENGRLAEERWHCRKDGQRFWSSVELMRLAEEDGDHVGYVKILRDRTEQHQAGKALLDAEAGLRRAQEVGGVGVFWVGVEDDVLHASPAFCRIFGLPERETYPAASFEQLIVPEDAHLVSGASSRRSGVPPRDVEYRIHRADTGQLRYIARKGDIELDEAGSPVRFSGVAQDVTERKNAEIRQAALLELGDRIRDLFDPVEISYAACQILGNVLGVSRVGYGTIDKVRETITIERDWNAPGIQSLAGTLHFRDYGSYIEDLKRGETVVFANAEADPRTKGMASALKAISAQAVVNMPLVEQGDFVALLYANHETPRSWSQDDLAFMKEVSERVHGATERARQAVELVRLKETLEQQVEERTRDRDRMWNLSTDVMLVADFRARIQAVNPAWTRLLGWQAEELLGSDFMNLVHPDDVKTTLYEVGRLAEGIKTLRFENRYRAKDGTFRWLSWTAVPHENFIHAVGRDVQMEKEAADALQRTEETLRQSQKMEAVGQLTGGLAHDFNNLLAGISGSLELMQARMSQGRLKDVDRYISAAQGATTRAAALTHRLLAFSRRQTLDPKPTNVNKLVSGMEDLIRRTVGPAIAIEVVGTADLWPVLVDPPQLENALLNLCINARDAMPDGGRIKIEMHNKGLDDHAAKVRDMAPGPYLSLCVSDTGTGMPPDVIAKAFDPFFTTKPIGEGTGLGLSMIYGFTKQSGGQVRIYSEVGDGTTVCIYLPRHYKDEVEEGIDTTLKESPRAEQGQTVLIVDDEPTVRMLVTEVLEDLGYTAIEASDSVAGLKVLQSDVRIDLLVTDVGLPGGMNGRQMADAGLSKRPHLKVLFITGYAENAVLNNGHLKPGMELLTKPFVMETLASRIQSMIADK
jgi:PAS domain S-box-containing protein